MQPFDSATIDEWTKLITSQDEALKKLQAVELGILEVIDAFCKKYDIKYFIDGGTALGAMRHNGFIPWDDDIDIGMLREDYDRFCELAADGLPEGFSLHTARNTEGYPALFAKVYKDGTVFENQEARESNTVMGIFVDVFPYDRLYEDPKLRSAQVNGASMAQKRSYLYYLSTISVPHKGLLGAIEKVGCSVLHHVECLRTKDPSVYQDLFDLSAPNPEVSVVSQECLTLAWPNMSPLPVDEIFPTGEAEFEGLHFPVPRETDKYLTTMYGDWRKIPAPGDRHTHLPLFIDFGDGEQWGSRQ